MSCGGGLPVAVSCGMGALCDLMGGGRFVPSPPCLWLPRGCGRLLCDTAC